MLLMYVGMCVCVRVLWKFPGNDIHFNSVFFVTLQYLQSTKPCIFSISRSVKVTIKWTFLTAWSLTAAYFLRIIFSGSANKNSFSHNLSKEVMRCSGLSFASLRRVFKFYFYKYKRNYSWLWCFSSCRYVIYNIKLYTVQ